MPDFLVLSLPVRAMKQRPEAMAMFKRGQQDNGEFLSCGLGVCVSVRV